MATIVDFGIDSDRHLGALQFAIKFGEVTPEELDAAMGNGAKLTEIVQRGENPYRDVPFKTSWDSMRLGPEVSELEQVLFGGRKPEAKRPEPEQATKTKDNGRDL